MARVLVLGAGFAGLWSAVGAARLREEIGAAAADVEILLVDRHDFHNIRVRNYEADLSDVAIPLGEVLDPIGVNHRVAEIRSIDPQKQEATIDTAVGDETLRYDRLVLALGSHLPPPSFPGASLLFDVDTYEAGLRLSDHLTTMGNDDEVNDGRETVVIVGAGFTGIEVAAEMTTRLQRAPGRDMGRVVLIDRNAVLGAGYSDEARAILEDALKALSVEVRLCVEIARVEPTRIHLTDGETIATRTIVWCAGMRPSPLATAMPAAHDDIGRVVVDEFMRASTVQNVFAAGDAASCMVDGTHPTVMSCQHARPMGRFAGHNAMADLCRRQLLPLRIDWYVTVLDLGIWGALYTVGRDRKVLAAGPAAKVVKQTINCSRIYPPRGGSRADILAAGAPVVQAPPEDVRLALLNDAGS